MKKILVGVVALVSLMSGQASADSGSAEALLHQMDKATAELNYELSYIWVRKNSIEPLRFRHAIVDNHNFSQLAYLSGPPREVIQRGHEVSYFEPGIEPFTIKSEAIVAPIPAVMQADIDDLAKYYDFISLGRAREAGLPCYVVRVVPKDGERYSYVIWVDERTKLLVRADLLDRDGDPIEQYRTVSLVVTPKVGEAMKQLETVKLPPVVDIPKAPNVALGWEVSKLPRGFKPVYQNRHRLLMTEKPVESQMFSDGLFSFSVYLSKADQNSVNQQMVRQGRRTLHSFVVGNTEVTVVGDIPPDTARSVAESVRFISPAKIQVDAKAEDASRQGKASQQVTVNQ